MAKKVKKAAKKVVKKVLDKTNVDEKIIANIDENRSLYNKILCYIKCYGGYALAIGADVHLELTFGGD